MDPQYIQRKEDKKAESQMHQGSGRSFAPPGLELTAGEPIQKKDNPRLLHNTLIHPILFSGFFFLRLKPLF